MNIQQYPKGFPVFTTGKGHMSKAKPPNQANFAKTEHIIVFKFTSFPFLCQGRVPSSNSIFKNAPIIIRKKYANNPSPANF